MYHHGSASSVSSRHGLVNMKHLLTTALVFQFLDMNEEFIIYVDTHDLGTGAMLSQNLETTEAITVYFST